jgi:hypothetical protein
MAKALGASGSGRAEYVLVIREGPPIGRKLFAFRGGFVSRPILATRVEVFHPTSLLRYVAALAGSVVATTALSFSTRPDLDGTTRLQLIALEWLKPASGPTQAGTMPRLVLRILLRFRRFRTRLSTRRGRVDDSAGSLLPEVACSELGNRWFDQPLEVGVADAHGVCMGTRPEYYRFIFR